GPGQGRARSRRGTNHRYTRQGGGSTSCRHPRDDLDLVPAVDLDKVHANIVARGGRRVLADEVGPDRELAMSTVDEDREADGARTSVVDEGVHRGADRAAGEEHVVDEHDGPAVDGEWDLRLTDDRRVPDSRQVIAIERDVDRTQRNIHALVRADGGVDAGGERVTAR